MSRESVSIGQELGSGQFGKVYLASAVNLPGARTRSSSVRSSGRSVATTVAVKYLSGSVSASERVLFIKEALRMKDLDHPHIVRLLGVCFESEPAFIVLEYMEKGDLKHVLQGLGSTISIGVQFDMVRQVSCALSYLADAKYVHRDIAARNVLVDGNDLLKISDFGL